MYSVHSYVCLFACMQSLSACVTMLCVCLTVFAEYIFGLKSQQ